MVEVMWLTVSDCDQNSKFKNSKFVFNFVYILSTLLSFSLALVELEGVKMVKVRKQFWDLFYFLKNWRKKDIFYPCKRPQLIGVFQQQD